MSAHTSGLSLSLVGVSKYEKNPFVIFRFTFMELTPSYIVILKNSHVFLISGPVLIGGSFMTLLFSVEVFLCDISWF